MMQKKNSHDSLNRGCFVFEQVLGVSPKRLLFHNENFCQRNSEYFWGRFTCFFYIMC